MNTTTKAHSTQGVVENQRFLIVSSLFSPDVLGGAEMCAENFAKWLSNKGAEVGILTTAKIREEAGYYENDGLKIWRLWMPRAYPQYYASRAKSWQKIFWHLQDHFDPRNRRLVAEVLDTFKPHYANIHLLQGIGYNVLLEISRRKIPTTFVLHDLGLACIRMGMFKKGKPCIGQCTACKASSEFKSACADTVPHLNYVSPSRANIDTLEEFFPVKKRATKVILNANRYPAPTEARQPSDTLRVLYVGRLHGTKGTHILLEAVGKLAAEHNIKITIVGSGPDEEALRAKYEDTAWCQFTGFITQDKISNIIINSDVLCVPSIWAENSPGVITHALSLGLPVLGSNKGGIPELVEHTRNGLLIEAGNISAWVTALENILNNPSQLNAWRTFAENNAYKFDQDYLGAQLLSFIRTNADA